MYALSEIQRATCNAAIECGKRWWQSRTSGSKALMDAVNELWMWRATHARTEFY